MLSHIQLGCCVPDIIPPVDNSHPFCRSWCTKDMDLLNLQCRHLSVVLLLVLICSLVYNQLVPVV